MTPPDASVIAPWIITFLTTCSAVYQGLKNRKKEQKSEAELELISDAKKYQDRATMLGQLADENLNLFKCEHAEHVETRQFWHDKATEYQATLSSCQEKLEGLKLRPDFSQIVEFIKQQAETSTHILTGIHEILKIIKDLTPKQL